MSSGNKKSFWEQTNAGDPIMMRYDKPADASVSMAANNAAGQAAFQNNFQSLKKSVENDDLFLKAFVYHEVKPRLYYGIDHYEQAPQRALQYFGLKSGGGIDPLPPIQYPQRYSLAGE
jgi:hypothetical protein